MSYKTQALPVPDYDTAPSKDATQPHLTEPDLKAVTNAPVPVARAALTTDPLATLKTMSEEEKIALFS